MSANKKDQLMQRLTGRDGQKPPMEETYEYKGQVLEQILERDNDSSKEVKNVRTNEPANVDKNGRAKELTNENTDEPSNEIKRKRFSFDLRPELHRDLKLQCIMDGTNMYEMVEKLIEDYLNERKNESV